MIGASSLISSSALSLAVAVARDPAYLRYLRSEVLTSQNILARLREDPGAPILLPEDPGTGKSWLFEGLCTDREAHRRYRLIIHAVSRRDIRDEQPLVKRGRLPKPLRGKLSVLRGRPRAKCGPDLDAEHRRHELAGTTQLAKRRVCGWCPKRTGCHYPEQLSEKQLKGTRVIVCTQAYWQAIPGFLQVVADKLHIELDRILLLLDEANLLGLKLRRHISHEDLRDELAVARAAGQLDYGEFIETFLDPASTLDTLQSPHLEREAVLGLQARGWSLHGGKYRHLYYELNDVASGAPWRTLAGIGYLRRPYLGGVDCVIGAAYVPVELARHRLADSRIRLISPARRLLHPETKIVNIRSSAGAACYFRKNAGSILWAAAQIIAREHTAGRRTVVVSRKKFVGTVVATLQAHLKSFAPTAALKVVRATEKSAAKPDAVPVLHYGMAGVNAFMAFDTVISANSYNLPEAALAEAVADADQPIDTIRATIRRSADGSHRAAVPGYFARLQGYEQLAQQYLDLMEAATVAQTVARVRFSTLPRTVIFMATGPLLYPPDQEYATLGAFCAALGLVTQRAWAVQVRRERAATLRAAGRSVAEIAAALQVDRRTVQRLLAPAEVEVGVGRGAA